MFPYALVPLDRLDDVLRRLDSLQRQLSRLENRMSKELDDLAAAVEADTAVDQSAITLLEGLKAQLDAAGTDRVKLKALSDSLGANQAKLAAAVAANTPAAETPPVETPPA